MKMMLAMQSQFNESMLKMQKEAAVREERTSQIFHAIHQQQEQMAKAMARDRETTTLMFDRLYQHSGIEPLPVQPPLVISAPSAHLQVLSKQLPLQPATSATPSSE